MISKWFLRKQMGAWLYQEITPGGNVALWKHPEQGWAIIAYRKSSKYALVIEHTDGNFLEISINKTIPIEGASEWPTENVFSIVI